MSSNDHKFYQEPTAKEQDDFRADQIEQDRKWARMTRDMREDGLTGLWLFVPFIKDPHVKLQLIRKALEQDGVSEDQIKKDIEHWKKELGI